MIDFVRATMSGSPSKITPAGWIDALHVVSVRRCGGQLPAQHVIGKLARGLRVAVYHGTGQPQG